MITVPATTAITLHAAIPYISGLGQGPITALTASIRDVMPRECLAATSRNQKLFHVAPSITGQSSLTNWFSRFVLHTNADGLQIAWALNITYQNRPYWPSSIGKHGSTFNRLVLLPTGQKVIAVCGHITVLRDHSTKSNTL